MGEADRNIGAEAGGNDEAGEEENDLEEGAGEGGEGGESDAGGEGGEDGEGGEGGEAEPVVGPDGVIELETAGARRAEIVPAVGSRFAV